MALLPFLIQSSVLSSLSQPYRITRGSGTFLPDSPVFPVNLPRVREQSLRLLNSQLPAGHFLCTLLGVCISEGSLEELIE